MIPNNTRPPRYTTPPTPLRPEAGDRLVATNKHDMFPAGTEIVLETVRHFDEIDPRFDLCLVDFEMDGRMVMDYPISKSNPDFVRGVSDVEMEFFMGL